MKKNNNNLFQEWLERAKDDELSASILLKEDGAPNTICFLSQQMAEKYLKSFLVFRDRKFPKVHQLDILLGLCIKIDHSFLNLKADVIFLSDFYVATRYPGDYPQFSFKDAKEALERASKIKDFILDKIYA